ncbi:hypothetical protein LZF95_01580 [Algoriphagus sp. AGSA1]|uniref:hypothetical protein n=1 Tax=Algoriphagus sp. AGSA1 TaxID=2907213 RepID=UPI001F413208|nr:hypothetical protein [Algoriphagus sp. AGSA1]MCE7053348.1 hypothetical protein [Algoriphagus sp. AGSA1]
MKFNLLYPTSFSLVLGVYFTLLSFQESPEIQLLGEWKEVSWEYEKLDSLISDESFDYMLTDHIKSQISKNLIIHKAEIWNFVDEHTLQMKNNDSQNSLKWTLKGRGNILQIHGSEGIMEYYVIQELSADRMVLHFSFDMQLRGIVKMTFERLSTKKA